MVKAAKKPRRFARVPKTKSGVPLKYLKGLTGAKSTGQKGKRNLECQKNTRTKPYPKAQ